MIDLIYNDFLTQVLPNYGWDETTHEMIDCPNHCPVFCDEATQMTCWMQSDANFCPQPSVCVDHGYESADGHWCSNHCPKTCNQGEKQCPDFTDDYGCTHPGECIMEIRKGWGNFDEAPGHFPDCPGICQ